MIRKIIKIDEDKCNGCTLCTTACHEGAIAMVNGKAKLIRDDYCDGLGNCLPVCPTGAITFEEREAAAFDEEAVKANMAKQAPQLTACPGSLSKSLNNSEVQDTRSDFLQEPVKVEQKSELNQWPVQLKLVAPNAAFFENAHLLIAADCSAFSYGNFHQDFMKDKITVIGCPKLDEGDYSEKIMTILQQNNIKSVTVVRMEVPCCGGLSNATITALQNCGKMIPWQVVTLSLNGTILKD